MFCTVPGGRTKDLRQIVTAPEHSNLIILRSKKKKRKKTHPIVRVLPIPAIHTHTHIYIYCSGSKIVLVRLLRKNAK